MFTLDTTVPVAKSICDGTPIPTASTGPVRAIVSRIAASIPSSSAAALDRSVGRSAISDASEPDTRPAATFVPPTSTPTTAGSGMA
jgi:hypothetical protein